MFETNPNIVQEPPESLKHAARPPVPIVLIHDGGGTIFSYYCLGMLDRPVYAIYNPHYGTDKVWAGGIPEMAAHYARLIRQAIPQGGDIILGGWSLGGLLSLEVSHILLSQAGARLRVLGIIMIDSVYPRAPQMQTSRIAQHALEWDKNTKQETREAVQRCFDEAGRMVREWTLPTWGAQEADDGRPPPVWLLRAQEPVPVLEEGVSRVDTYRQDRCLGWDQYRADLIVRVEDIPGHHFNIFSLKHVDAVTEKLKRACVEVEEWAGPR